ncbi:zn(2)-C6 fungal-type transcription factor [Rhodotorula toruloides]|uniref:Zn(2)-C6 fungal-type transcription factor n=1 Tax=Rhodotorula toruloides TaxID=5286 RepID=A0A511KDF8_RHOTO|nr:zn(2)-C6 fungal-type transcription factor [Rhodotorula toruloides]
MVCAATADVLLRAGAVRPTVRTLATLHGTRIRTLLQADLPKPSRPSSRSGCGSFFSNPNTPGSSTPQTAMSGLIGSTSPFMSVAAAEVPTHALLEAQEQGLLFPSAPSLFNLPPSDSHALWDLFHEHAPVSATAGESTTLREDATGVGEGSAMVDGTNDGASGGGMSGKPDGWMYKSALDQDWLSSEPGAWAW